MFTRSMIFASIFGIAGLVAGFDATPVFAQRGGGGHGGGGHGGGGHVGGGGAHYGGGGAHYGGTHYGNYGGSSIYRGGLYGSGIYIGGLGGGYYGGGYYGGGRYNYGSPYYYGSGGYYPYSYSSGVTYASPQTVYYPPVQDPNTLNTAPTTPPAETPKNAQVKVLVPDPQAKVWFDGAATSTTGSERLFHTPDLTAGYTYSYRVRASWIVNGKEQVQEQVIQVAPGRGVVVDFTQPVSEVLQPPPAKQ